MSDARRSHARRDALRISRRESEAAARRRTERMRTM